MSKILVVEDDAALAQVIADSLKGQGHAIDVAYNANEALTFLDLYPYGLLILDWVLQDSGVTGLDLLKIYRKKGGTAPVLMLTGRCSIADKEIGFGAGADDYLNKPFMTRELELRVHALLRRPSLPDSKRGIICVGSLSLDPVKRVVSVDGKRLSIRRREFAVLEHFMRHPDHVLSVESIISAVWESDDPPSDMAVRVAIKRLRDRIKEALGKELIETVHGMGYQLRKH